MLLKVTVAASRDARVVSSRDVVSDQVWQLIGPLFPPAKPTGRPPVDRRTVVEAMAWRFRTGAPWRDLPERFGNWNTIYRNFDAHAVEHATLPPSARSSTGQMLVSASRRRLVIGPLTPRLMPLTVREVKRPAAALHRSSAPSLAG